MATILCPTRGGEASHPAQDQAISLAGQRGAKLIFLYVSDVRFLFKGSAAIVVDLEEELDEMGKFLLTMAQERAEERGVTADRVVKHGAFQDALLEVIEEHNVTTVVLGAPAGDDGLTTEDYVRELAESLSQDHGVEVFLVGAGEPVIHKKA